MLKQKNSELQKHFPNKKLQKKFKICIKKQQNQEFKTQKGEKKAKNKSDPFFDKIKKQKKI